MNKIKRMLNNTYKVAKHGNNFVPSFEIFNFWAYSYDFPCNISSCSNKKLLQPKNRK